MEDRPRHVPAGQRFGPFSQLGPARRLAEVQPRTVQFALEAIYVPSPLFVRRHGLDRIVSAAEERAAGEAGVGDLDRLGRLLFGLGRYGDAEHWLTRAVELAPHDADIRTYPGLARALTGRIAQGLATCRLATEMAPGSARASAFLAVALALHAATTTGFGEAWEVLRSALQEARRSRALEPRGVPERMEVLLSRGAHVLGGPPPLTGHDEGEAELREVLARTEGATDADNGFDLPGTTELYLVHALYYPGVSAREAGHLDEARWLLRECIVIDPASRSAERAYELLSAIDWKEAGRGHPARIRANLWCSDILDLPVGSDWSYCRRTSTRRRTGGAGWDRWRRSSIEGNHE